MISNCSHDENGKYSGGKPGDQTGKEWVIQNWYNRPWNYIFRHPNKEVVDLIVLLATKSAENDHIGYDQGDRYSFWNCLKKVGYMPEKIITNCNADCSAGVAAIVKAIGFILGIKELQDVSIYAYTGDLRSYLTKAGFQVLTDSKYLESDDYLEAGDILLYENHHVATCITTGTKADGKWYESAISAQLKVTTDANVRSGPGTSYKVLASVNKKDVVVATGKAYYKDKWWAKTSIGWISMSCLSGWIFERDKWWYLTERKDYNYYANVVVKIDGKYYAFDKDGWMITADRIGSDGSIK